MKMRKSVVQITIEYPAGRNWTEYVSISGGQTVKSSVDRVEHTDLGDVDPPWGQNMREMYTVRKIIADGLRASLPNMPDLIVNVTGSKSWGQAGGWAYYANFVSKKAKNALVYSENAYLPKEVLAIQGLTWILEPGGALIWEKDRGGKKLTTMQVGNPDIVNEITNYLLKLYKK